MDIEELKKENEALKRILAGSRLYLFVNANGEASVRKSPNRTKKDEGKTITVYAIDLEGKTLIEV